MSDQRQEENHEQQQQPNQQPKREGILKNGNVMSQDPYMRRVESATDQAQFSRNRNYMPYQYGPYPIPVDNHQRVERPYPGPIEGNSYERPLPHYSGQQYRQYRVPQEQQNFRREEGPYIIYDQREQFRQERYKGDQFQYQQRIDPRYFRPYDRNPPQNRSYYQEYGPHQQQIQNELVQKNKDQKINQQRLGHEFTQPKGTYQYDERYYDRQQFRPYYEYPNIDYPPYMPRVYDQGPPPFYQPPPSGYHQAPRHLNTLQDYERREFNKSLDFNERRYHHQEQENQQYIQQQMRYYYEQRQDIPQYKSPAKVERVKSMYLSPQALEKLRQENVRGRSFSPQTQQNIQGQVRNRMTPNPYRQYHQSNQLDRYDLQRDDIQNHQQPRAFDSMIRRM